MSRTASTPKAPLPWTAALLLVGCALAPTISAQDALSGSEQHVLIARTTAAAGGAAGSESFGVRLALGDTGAAQRAGADGLTFTGGVAWLDGPIGAGPPVLFQVVASSGGASGGEAARALGFNFDAPGSGATLVMVADGVANGLAIPSNTTIEFTTPPGTNSFGNPLGSVEVEVLNLLGTAAIPGAYDYLPSISQEGEARIGEPLELVFRSTPSEFAILAVGTPIPGVAVPIPSFAGALEIPLGVQVLSGPDLVATGEHVYLLPVPDNPNLAGKTVSFQGATFGADSSFTNRLDVLVTL